jgi:mycothiol S-conjugate amidase
MDERLSLLAVHAHPDDEASKGAGTVAKYSAEGVHTVLVTCTGGEEGDILNPAMDTPEVRADIGGVRAKELQDAVEVIGYDELVLLGYRDSGMKDSDANSHPDAFAAADIEDAIERLVKEIRRARPQVILTYGDDHSGYPHPDHIRVHDISVAAFAAAGDPEAFPEAGDPFEPSKLYYNVWSRQRILDTHAKFLELGLESPFDERWLDRPGEEDKITTSINLEGFEDVRRRALLAHATQVDPTSKFWFGLPPEVQRTIYPFDDYVLAQSRVASILPESDLFAGLRVMADRS